MRATVAACCVLTTWACAAAWPPPPPVEPTRPPPEPYVAVRSMAVTPDGKHLLVGLSDDSPESLKGLKPLIRMIDLKAGKEVKNFLGHKRVANSLAVTPDGKHLVSTSSDEEVRVWSLQTAKQVRSFPEGNSPCATVSPDGKQLVTWRTGRAKEPLHVWDLASGKRERTIEGPGGGIGSAEFFPDGTKLLLRMNQTRGTPADYSAVKILDVKTGKATRSFDEKEQRWKSVGVIGPDSRSLLLQRSIYFGQDKRPHHKHSLVLWDAETQKETASWPLAEVPPPVRGDVQAEWMRWTFFRRDGKRAFVVDDLGTMALLDLKTGKKAWEKKHAINPWLHEVFHVRDDTALVVTLSVEERLLPRSPTQDGVPFRFTWYDLDTGKERETKDVEIKW